jgi:murein DD-endopeptidase MepM/ murein hydrolase activator NlpD
MPTPRSLRRAAMVMALVTGMSIDAVGASARTPLEEQLAARAEVERTIDHLRRDRERTVRRMRAEIDHGTNRVRHMIGRGATSNPERFLELRHELLQERRDAAKRIRRSARVVARRVEALQARRRSIDSWIAIWGIFRYCPVRGWHSIADNFGITVRLPDVPVHRHTGSDIAAYSGTPIVAPFDGYASASSSELGGLEVRVTGSRGYVYNAHLSSYGSLGYVRAGTVIGYVGATGDATVAHDHFEWHPYGGSAVDAYPYLRVSCG